MRWRKSESDSGSSPFKSISILVLSGMYLYVLVYSFTNCASSGRPGPFCGHGGTGGAQPAAGKGWRRSPTTCDAPRQADSPIGTNLHLCVYCLRGGRAQVHVHRL